MSISRREQGDGPRRFIAAWFALDAVVALAPPLYWHFDGDRTAVLGVPAVVLYFIAVATCIALSIVAAYALETRDGEAG